MDEVRRPDFTLSNSKFAVKDKPAQDSRFVKRSKQKDADLGTDESAIDSFITSDSQKHIGRETRKSPSPPKSQINNFRISMSKPALNSSRGFQQSSKNLASAMANSKLSTNSMTKKQVTAMLEKQEDILQGLDKNKREIDVEMLVQCRLNSTHFEGLRDKKRMAQQMQSHMQAMLQEYKLMEKQLDEKAKAAKIFQKRAETVKELNSIKQQRKNALKSHREQQTEMNQKQVADGRFRKEQSMEAKDNLQRAIWREKHKQYLEVRNRELEDVKRAMGDLGSEVNQKVIRARYSKIELQEGRISQRKYIKGKLESLDRDLVSRIDSKTQDIEQIWNSMQMIQQRQKQLNEHLKHVDSAFHESQKELAKVAKLTQTEVKILKKPTLTKDLMQDLTFSHLLLCGNKDFNDFADKVRKAESLYRAESRKNSEYQTETASVQKGARQFYHTATLFVDEKSRKPTTSLSVRSPSLGDLGAAKRNPLAKSSLPEKGKISQSVLFKGPQTSR